MSAITHLVNKSAYLRAGLTPGNDDAPFSREVLDIAVTEIETIVEPDSVGNDIGRESVAFVRIHHQIISFW